MLLNAEEALVVASKARARPVAAVVEFMSTAFIVNVLASLSMVTSFPALANIGTLLKLFVPMSLM